jgi:hypothetical protein
LGLLGEVKMATPWKCSYCGHSQIISSTNNFYQSFKIAVGENTHGNPAGYVHAIACLNTACRELDLVFQLGEFSHWENSGAILGELKERWQLLPASSAKPQPGFIPEALRDDYYEACAIADLSPKASATLARRCLQGMIRYFCKISRGRLIDEINDLRAAVEAGAAPRGVTHESVEAIDHVRSIGNIGAHMEADVNVIVDVDPGEAEALLRLIELLFDEWYVSQDARSKKLAAVEAIAKAKKDEIQAAKDAKKATVTQGHTGAV